MLEHKLVRVAGVTVSALVGAAGGLGFFTFGYARGASYMTNRPEACANCHVMRSQYEAWSRSSHRAVATCNDCHAPHELVGKYKTKAINGYNHSLAFTTGRFPEPIRITPRNEAITEAACRYCHADITAAIDSRGHGDQALSCIRCHRSVGHLH